MSLLLPRDVAARRQREKAEAAANNIAGSRTYELQSDEFVTPRNVMDQLMQLADYVRERRAGERYALPRPSGWKLMVLMLTLPEETKGGIALVDDAREQRAVTSPQGVVLAMGEACYTDPDRFTLNGRLTAWHRPGQRITWVKYDAHLFKLANGQILGFLTDTQPVALIDDGWEDAVRMAMNPAE
jgi:hypothetical protein